MKAIHNTDGCAMAAVSTVFNETKLINLKAIHNAFRVRLLVIFTVFNETKLINLKAIHNKIWKTIDKD